MSRFEPHSIAPRAPRRTASNNATSFHAANTPRPASSERSTSPSAGHSLRGRILLIGRRRPMLKAGPFRDGGQRPDFSRGGSLSHTRRRRLHGQLAGALGMSLWSRRRTAMQHPVSADVLVDIRPVNSVAATDKDPVGTLRRSGIDQPPGPLERHTNHSPINKMSRNHFRCNLNVPDTGFSQNRSVHAMLQRCAPRVR